MLSINRASPPNFKECSPMTLLKVSPTDQVSLKLRMLPLPYEPPIWVKPLPNVI